MIPASTLLRIRTQTNSSRSANSSNNFRMAKSSRRDKQRFTETATDVRKYVYELVDVQLVTLNNLPTRKGTYCLKANMVFQPLDPRRLTQSVAFTQNNTLVRISAGDLYQLTPCTMNSSELSFTPQMQMLSFFSSSRSVMQAHTLQHPPSTFKEHLRRIIQPSHPSERRKAKHNTKSKGFHVREDIQHHQDRLLP